MVKENTSLEYEKVIHYIYELIQNGTLIVGSKLPTERAIAEELKIGRNSTREALSILHGMGMIERVQGSGNFISKNAGRSISQILRMMLALGTISKREVFEFRRVLDRSVCDILIEKGFTKEKKTYFEENLQNMKSAKGKRLTEVDKEFHDALIIATENVLFITIMEAVTEVYREWIDAALQKANDEEKKKLLHYHHDIFQSILDQNKGEMHVSINRHYDLIEEML